MSIELHKNLSYKLFRGVNSEFSSHCIIGIEIFTRYGNNFNRHWRMFDKLNIYGKFKLSVDSWRRPLSPKFLNKFFDAADAFADRDDITRKGKAEIPFGSKTDPGNHRYTVAFE